MKYLVLLSLSLFSDLACAIDEPPYSFILLAIQFFNGQNHLQCPPSVPPRPLVDTKDFLKLESVTPTIRESIKAVRELCFCENSSSTCGTFVAIGNGLFLTNEHVIEALLADKASYEKSKGGECDWLVARPDGDASKITFNIKKRGWWNHHDPRYTELDHSKDLAIVLIPELAIDSYLKISREPTKLNDQVLVAGFPTPGRYIKFNRSPLIPAISSGVVTSTNPVNNSADFIGVNGMSGGAVLNQNGELAGIFWGKEVNKRDSILWYREPDGSLGLPKQMPQETSYFIPADQVNNFILGTNKKLRKTIDR